MLNRNVKLIQKIKLTHLQLLKEQDKYIKLQIIYKIIIKSNKILIVFQNIGIDVIQAIMKVLQINLNY